MSISLRALVAGFVLAVVTGCSPRPPTLTPRSAEVTSATAQGLGLRVHLTANNPNWYGLTVQSVHIRVTLASQDLGMVDIPNATELPAGRDVPVDADLTVPWVNLPGLILTTVLNPAVPYRLDGTVRVGGSRIHMDVPFLVQSTLPRQVLIDAAGAGVTPILNQLPIQIQGGSP